MIGIFGGVFDPPHNGHVALVQTAVRDLELDAVVVLVSSDPEHKITETPAVTRAQLAQAAFPWCEVVLDSHARTVDELAVHPQWEDAAFLIGADQFADFLSWKEPDEVLRHVKLGVAAREGVSRDRLDGVRAALQAPDRVIFFDLEPWPISSREVRAQLAAGEDVTGLIPPDVYELIQGDDLYRRAPGYTEPA
jgi:nicotinate-nucleotide adenylyltransferase